MALAIAREANAGERRRIVEALTALLPQWFGRPEANARYAQQAEGLEAWSARIDGRAIGLLLLKRHGDASAEIYWLGIAPDRHRQGVGRDLIGSVERHLRQAGVKWLFVMTLHPGDPYEPYRRTRAFYEALGFELALDLAQIQSESTSDALAYYLKPL